jgi:hypothetical protein
VLDIADAVYVLQDLFINGPDIPCEDAADTNDDGDLNVADAVYLLQHLFVNGPEIPAPHPECGDDTTPDDLSCVETPCEVPDGGAFFFCLDRSASMEQRLASGNMKFDVLKCETIEVISALTKRSVASVVFFDSAMAPSVYGDPPLVMNAAGKVQLISQVASTPLSSGTCLARGMLRTLEIAGQTEHAHRTIILISEGRLTCPNGETEPGRAFQTIMAANEFRIPINTIFVGQQSGFDWTLGKPLLERLARATNGTFKIAE